MKKQKYFWVVAILVIIAGWFLFHKSEVQTSGQHEPATNVATITNPVIPNSVNHVPASNSVAPVTVAGVNSSFPDNANYPPDIVARYKHGLINKGEAMLEIYKWQNNQPQDFYGKIVDQNGQPVAGVEVTGSIVVMGDLGDGAQNQTYKTESDSDGLFEFTGNKGWKFNVTVKKEGYLMGERSEGYKSPVGEKTSPMDRAILTMWKLHGAESLVSSSFESAIPNDGTPTAFDMLTQKQSPQGDLQVTLLRSPLQVRRSGQKFDWAVKIEMLHGGLVTENDPYPYWAAESGYEPSFEFDMSSNNVPWRSTVTQNFYIKSSGGQYGRMQVNIYSALTPARVKFDFWVNPSGSQNLEPTIAK